MLRRHKLIALGRIVSVVSDPLLTVVKNIFFSKFEKKLVSSIENVQQSSDILEKVCNYRAHRRPPSQEQANTTLTSII